MNGLRPFGGGDTSIDAFLCPSVDLPRHVPSGSYFNPSSNADLVGTGYATSHYKASRGPCDRGMFWRTNEGLGLKTPCTEVHVDINGDGILDDRDYLTKDRYTRIRIQDVLDGTSKTIAIGEAAYFVSAASFPMWMGTYDEDGSVLFKTQNPINCNLGGPRAFPLSSSDIQQLLGGDDDCAYSWHVGGAVFGFVDGSVRFLTENLELRTFVLMGDRMDGQVINDHN